MKDEPTDRRKITFQIPSSLDEQLIEYLKDRWREGHQKQGILTRGTMLALYELYTGQSLVTFDTTTTPDTRHDT
jgi:hypothetical protein